MREYKLIVMKRLLILQLQIYKNTYLNRHYIVIAMFGGKGWEISTITRT